METVSVLLVDEDLPFCQEISDWLQRHHSLHIKVVGLSVSHEDALEQAQRLRPQVVLLGLNRHSFAGLYLIPILQAMLPGLRIVVMGELDLFAYYQAALQAGADAFVPKMALDLSFLSTLIGLSNDNAASVPVGAVPRLPRMTHLHTEVSQTRQH